MPDDEKTEPVEPETEFEEDLTGYVYNLSAALGCLIEIDGAMLNKRRQAKLARMKRQIFDSLEKYCDCLPQVDDDPEE